jgi:hypothetical protein
MCTSTQRCCTCGVGSLHRYCRIGVVASRSSWHWGRLHRLHHQLLCGGVIPMSVLQGHITESPANRCSITNR